jgi:hypothetical protein
MVHVKIYHLFLTSYVDTQRRVGRNMKRSYLVLAGSIKRSHSAWCRNGLEVDVEI